MRKLKYFSLLFLFMLLLFTTSCKRDNILKTTVKEIDKYGHVVLKISKDDFEEKGFKFGDVVEIEINKTKYSMPYFSGYYVDEGEYVLYGSNKNNAVSICINYGNFSNDTNTISGDQVIIRMLEKEGMLGVQITSSLVHSNYLTDFESEEVFSNFRMVTSGNIKENILYRSASPINNKHLRASITNKLIAEVGIKTVANLADNKEIIYEAALSSDFNSEYYVELYENNHVHFFPLTLNFRSDEFARLATEAVIYISENDGPYLVHCTEGDYRTDFVIMLITLLMGATVEEICEDYMLTYKNYYNITKESDPTKYNNILEGFCMESLRTIANVEKGGDISGVNFEQSAEDFLLEHGMTTEQIQTLKEKLVHKN